VIIIVKKSAIIAWFRILLSLAAGVRVANAAAESPNLLAAPANWTTWAPRAELAPKSAIETRDGATVLVLEVQRFEQYGQWVSLVSGIEPEKYYRFEAKHRSRGVDAERMNVFARLSWFSHADGTGELQRDYVDSGEAAEAWHRSFRTLRAPAGAQSVRVELGLRWTSGGSVAWKDVQLVAVPAPAPRTVRVATTRVVPGAVRTIANNTRLMAEMFDRAATSEPDILLFSETLSARSTRLPLEEKAETIPGPLTDMLAERARKYRCYVITSLHERDGGLFYNTAVLIDRDGRIAGKYRKVHLATSEADAGLTPGSEYPVFTTDFGRIGILVCWDNWFSEPARILRLKGAEMLFLPLAGDGSDAHWQAAARARAMDNGLYFVSSGTVSDASCIITPNGEVLAEARGNFAYVVQDLDLNAEWRQRYLSVASGMGEGKSLYIVERRPDTYQELSDTAIPAAERR
jgi:predicted amidohydrolase